MDELTDLVEVKRRNRQGRSYEGSEEREQKSRRMVQIFIKIDGSKETTMEVELTDKMGVHGEEDREQRQSP